MTAVPSPALGKVDMLDFVGRIDMFDWAAIPSTSSQRGPASTASTISLSLA
ncbi:hypothetical protein IFR23_09585 [Sphingomonas sp. CFBP 13603]|uniref:hypothetical protein n=1 Tax=Sphingomonas sp. CFBP 13603 TaxID=2774040 RepID=UPI001868EF2B|nr:hypothetical protein [Sphingomonas sp. CFBP 13603]MBE2992268.1 hypothetical protein [Sphingomonas sp. CFBP 13603]